MDEILSLNLDEVSPDNDQPRQCFEAEPMKELKSALQRWGQMQPIIVRKEDDGYVIVDGERRWRVLKEIAKEQPQKTVKIRAMLGTNDDQNTVYRKARQLVANATSQDFNPAEKANAIACFGIKANENESFGLTDGNLKMLRRLAGAADYVREFGSPRNGDSKKKEHKALPLMHLIELVALDKIIRSWDLNQAKKDKEHKPIAMREVRKVAVQAQREEWSKIKIKAECTKIAESLGKEKKMRSTGTAAIIKSIHTMKERLTKVLDSDIEESELNEMIDALTALVRAAQTKQLEVNQPAA